MMLFTAIDHPAIACHDVRKLADWYCKTLGMRIIAQNDAAPPAMIVGYDETARGGAVIELMPVKDPGAHPAEFHRFQPGLRHLAIRVSDFDAACSKLKAAGVQFLGEPGTAVGGGPIVSFRDPEGNELQIVQR
jgi:catechol 2,3-dioxygenase-like lactoylglutathione lyase family enzyme